MIGLDTNVLLSASSSKTILTQSNRARSAVDAD